MSLWRWTRNSKASGLVCASILLASVAGADSPSSVSSGPTSPKEAEILLQDGKADFERGLDEEAIPKLERYVARYPGYPEYFEARHLLGQAYLRQHKDEQAVSELRAYILAKGKAPSAIRARLELARAQLELRQFNEALLTAEEAVKLSPKPAQAPEHAEALILVSRAQLGLKQESRARASIASAQKSFPSPKPTRLAGEALSVELELKLRECHRFPSSEVLEESQVRDQLARRGTCLLEALNLFHTISQTDPKQATEPAQVRVSNAYSSYWDNCTHPPAPPPLATGKRDAQQLKTYFRELSVVLEEDCRQKIRQGSELLKSWEQSASSPALDSLKKAEAALASRSERPK